MSRYPREGTKPTYIVLGIIALLLLIIFVSLYLFHGSRERAHTDKPQSSQTDFRTPRQFAGCG